MMSILVSLLLLILFMSGGMSSCVEKERQALLDVKANLNNENAFLVDWGSEEEKMDCCKWACVTCDSHTGHVIELGLNFSSSGFTGKISPSLQVLNQLQNLFLSYIDFQSNPLPNFLGSLSKLERLYISSANLSGPIPHQLANLSNLLELDLSHNSLGGSIPFNFGHLTSLTYLDLSENQLGGVIPKSFENCSSLVTLDLSQNLLSGSLPSFFGFSSLTTLSLAHNSLNGSMPDFTGCTSLKHLDLSNNFLSRNMSSSVFQLSNLEYLNVNNNSFNGSIPNFIGCLSLGFLDMPSNKLSGNVPKTLGQLSSLTYLDFSSNSLEGVIFEVHFLNLTQLTYLDLSFNSVELNLSFQWKSPFQLFTIKLQSCKLGPKFPAWIKTQKLISKLDISNAGISDSIPVWFTDLSSGLNFLNLSSNEIKGTLPHIAGYNGAWYSDCLGMDLSNNLFEGKVSLLPSRLAALNLSGNKFSGTLSFLCEIEEFLTFLDLSNNSFSGSLPDCWLNFQKMLVVLNLSNNNLWGKIPSSLGNFLSLEALYLRTNAFVGELPVSLSSCIRLRFLDLGENKLSGVIPEWIGENLSELYVLVLGSNRFHGRLPSQVCWLYNLQVLDMSNNELSGDIPRCFVNFTAMARISFGDDMITKHLYYISIVIPPCFGPAGNRCSRPPYHQETYFQDNALVKWKGQERSFKRIGLQLLKSIDLSRNNFSGVLPYEITSLYDLASLNLSINKLHGEVLKNMGLLKSLESLDLSRNEFSGHIPSSLAHISSLSYLDLSNNNLSGRIPTGTQLQSFNYTSYSGNPQLCGPPLTPRCGISHPLGKKDVEENEDDSWKSYYTGMGTGFAVGFLGICGALVLNPRCRHFFFVSVSLIKDWIYVIVVVHFRKLERKFTK